LWRSHAFVGEFIQPRYLLPGLPFLMAVALLDRDGTSTVPLPKAPLWLAGCGVVIANSAALLTNIVRYAVGLGGDVTLDSRVTWWVSQVPPSTTWIIGSVAVLIAAMLGLVLVGSDFSAVRNPSRRASRQ
jgi:hypothetical protein